MPLDDNEQKILAEIERQFYEEDPELARAVRRIERPNRVGVRLASIGVLVGLAIIVYFLGQTYVAAAGFLILVISATSLVQGLRSRALESMPSALDDDLDE